MAERISRRSLLKAAGLGAAGLGLVACEPLDWAARQLGYAPVLPTSQPQITPGLSPTPLATAEATATTMPTSVVEGSHFVPARRSGDKWVLHTSDNALIDVSLPAGYTPDSTLNISSDVHADSLEPVPQAAADFQKYLNNPHDKMGALAGFTDSVNDYNQYFNHESGPQLPAYSWETFTGLIVNIPGIGRVEGGAGRAAMVLILNRTDKVYRWPTNSVYVEAGFEGWGRIWNGDASHTQEAEKRLTQHYLTRLGQGVSETGFIGQCDQGAKNCDEVTVVSAERIQWGNIFQFRLIRAETVTAVK